MRRINQYLCYGIPALVLAPCLLLAQVGWHWQNPLPQGQALNGIGALDGGQAIAVGGSATVLKTADGALWQVQHSVSGAMSSLEAVQFVDANTGYAVGAGDLVLKTTDAGATWTSLTTGTFTTFNDVFFVNADTGWAVGGPSSRRPMAGKPGRIAAAVRQNHLPPSSSRV